MQQKNQLSLRTETHTQPQFSSNWRKTNNIPWSPILHHTLSRAVSLIKKSNSKSNHFAWIIITSYVSYEINLVVQLLVYFWATELPILHEIYPHWLEFYSKNIIQTDSLNTSTQRKSWLTRKWVSNGLDLWQFIRSRNGI